jgi:UDP-N-acetylglucosamine transferase subunit ALG13
VTKKPFTFVTVGSTDFDPLIRAVDHLDVDLPVSDKASAGIMQIGHGQYIPVSWPYFRFAPSLDAYYDRATLVIAHGGLATTMEVLMRGVPLVSVSNPDRYDHHQDDLLSAMDREGYLVWCRRLDQLAEAVEAARTDPLKRYRPAKCEIHLVINEFLSSGRRPH